MKFVVKDCKEPAEKTIEWSMKMSGNQLEIHANGECVLWIPENDSTIRRPHGSARRVGLPSNEYGQLKIYPPL